MTSPWCAERPAAGADRPFGVRSPRVNDTAPPPLPRGLILLASLWLIGSWLVSIGAQRPLQPSSASYTPGVRGMLLSVALGLVVAWPLLRLSRGVGPQPLRSVALDLAVLIALIQVVVWPLRLVTPWGLARTAAIDLALVAWTLVIAGVIAGFGGLGGRGRTVGMVLCLALIGVIPLVNGVIPLSTTALAWLGGSDGVDLSAVAARSSPFSLVHAISSGGPQPIEPADLAALALAGSAALAIWGVVVVSHLVRASRATAAPRKPGEMAESRGS